jgi:hypothetical protein
MITSGVRSTTFWIAGACLAATAFAAMAAQPPVTDYDIGGQFQGKEAGERAKDLSGIACITLESGKTYSCLAVNDENQTAQFARIEGERMTPGTEIRLIGEDADASTLGAKPEVPCPNGEAAFGEFDGEGVAYSAPYFYVVGSHGCARRKGKFRLSSFMLARIHVDGEGRPIDAQGQLLQGDDMSKAVETTYRLSDLLPRADEVGPYFGKLLNADDRGLNVEGIAVGGGQVYLGLRAPSLKGNAFILKMSADELFKPGHDPASATAELVTIPIMLGKKTGIRDLALLPDGKLLVLTGAAYESDRPYSIFVFDPARGDAEQVLPEQEDQPQRAEAITVLESSAKEIRVLLLFDGALNGAPREFRIPLP